MARNLKIEIIKATCYLSLTLDFVCNFFIDLISGQPRTRVHNLHLAVILFRMKIIIHFEKSKKSTQGRAVGVVAGATRAFGRRTQGVWGAGPPTAGGELSGYQALKPPQINIDLTKSLKCESSFSQN